MKPGRLNAFLVIVILLTAGGIYIVLQDSARSVNPSGSRSLLNLKEESIQSLFLQVNGLQVEVQRQDGDWMLVRPLSDRASDDAVRQLVRNLSGLRVKKVVGSTHEPARQFGITPGSDQITYSDGFETYSLRIGRETPVGDGTYVQDPDARHIGVTDTSLRNLLPESWEPFRERDLFPGTPDTIERIQLQSADGTIHLLRTPPQQWTLVEPVSSRANSDAVQTFLQELLRHQILDFAADRVSDPGIYGIDETRPSIQVEWTDSTVGQRIRIGSRREDTNTLFVTSSDRGGVFTVQDSLLELAGQSTDHFRDRRPLPVQPEWIDRIELEFPTFSTLLEKTAEGTWIVRRTEPYPALADKIQNFLTLWTSPVIQSFSTNGPPPAPAAQTNVESTVFNFREQSADGPSREWTFQLRPTPSRPDGVAAYSRTDEEGFILPTVLASRDTLAPVHFIKPVLWNLDPETIRGLEITFPDLPLISLPQEHPRFNEIARRLAQLTPLNVIEEQAELTPKPYFDEGQPTSVKVLLPSEQGISKTLYLGSWSDQGNRFAKRLGSPLVFLLNQEDLEFLDSLRPAESTATP